MDKKQTLRHKRHLAIRHKVVGTAARPRVSVYRGTQHIYIQVIDDAAGRTLVGMSDKTAKAQGTGTERAVATAKAVAAAMKDKNITTASFDRAGFQYHGQVKAVADTLREAGITI